MAGLRLWSFGLLVLLALPSSAHALSKEMEEFYKLFSEPSDAEAAPTPAPRRRSSKPKPAPNVQIQSQPLRISGSYRGEAAARLVAPRHFSKLRSTFLLAGTGAYSENLSYKVSGRLRYDSIYDLTDHYPKPVKDDQRWDAHLRDTYIDYSHGPWDTRIGKQQIVWGEAVGSFVADVVNAKDFRELILQDFESIRIPEWGMNLEYTHDQFHAEGIWLPFPEMHQIARPGGEFEIPMPLPDALIRYGPAEKPTRSLENSQYGTRLAYRPEGWDVAAFVLRTWDKFPVYRVAFDPASQTFLFTETHPRQTIEGFTISTEIRDVVYKGEMVYIGNKSFQSTDLSRPQGLIEKDVVNYLLGADLHFGKWRTLYQFNQQYILDHESAIYRQDAFESTVAIYIGGEFLNNRLLPELTLVKSVDSTDILARPKITYKFLSQWRLSAGLDLLGGPRDDFFGAYRDYSRAYTEVRFDF
jgi:hypothetical protein